jgi:brefeldin A-resistance guanine nucleotide exchange factor 1
MADGGYLAPPYQDPTKEKIWTETRKRLDRFLPHLFAEIFPESPKDRSAPVSAMASPLPVPESTNDDKGHNDEKHGSPTVAVPADTQATVESEVD